MNKDNRLNLWQGSNLLILTLDSGDTIAVPTQETITKNNPCGARVLDVNQDGSFTAHWLSNWNTNGDFRTELMSFDANLEMIDDRLERNTARLANGLMSVEA